MTVYAITDTKKGRTGIAPTYLHTTRSVYCSIRKLTCGLWMAEINDHALKSARPAAGAHKRYLAFSFLCTFVPGSEKSIKRTFASVEHSLPGSEKSKNFHSMELSHPWNFRSSGANVLRTFAPWNFRTPGTFVLQTTFVPFNFCSCGNLALVLKKSCGKQECSVSIGIFWQTFAERKRCHVLYNNCD